MISTKTYLQIDRHSKGQNRHMVQYFYRVVVQIQPRQVRRVFEQVPVQGVYFVEAQVEGLEGDGVVNAVLVRPLEDLAA